MAEEAYTALLSSMLAHGHASAQTHLADTARQVLEVPWQQHDKALRYAQALLIQSAPSGSTATDSATVVEPSASSSLSMSSSQHSISMCSVTSSSAVTTPSSAYTAGLYRPSIGQASEQGVLPLSRRSQHALFNRKPSRGTAAKQLPQGLILEVELLSLQGQACPSTSARQKAMALLGSLGPISTKPAKDEAQAVQSLAVQLSLQGNQLEGSTAQAEQVQISATLHGLPGSRMDCAADHVHRFIMRQHRATLKLKLLQVAAGANGASGTTPLAIGKAHVPLSSIQQLPSGLWHTFTVPLSRAGWVLKKGARPVFHLGAETPSATSVAGQAPRGELQLRVRLVATGMQALEMSPTPSAAPSIQQQNVGQDLARLSQSLLQKPLQQQQQGQEQEIRPAGSQVVVLSEDGRVLCTTTISTSLVITGRHPDSPLLPQHAALDIAGQAHNAGRLTSLSGVTSVPHSLQFMMALVSHIWRLWRSEAFSTAMQAAGAGGRWVGMSPDGLVLGAAATDFDGNAIHHGTHKGKDSRHHLSDYIKAPKLKVKGRVSSMVAAFETTASHSSTGAAATQSAPQLGAMLAAPLPLGAASPSQLLQMSCLPAMLLSLRDMFNKTTTTGSTVTSGSKSSTASSSTAQQEPLPGPAYWLLLSEECTISRPEARGHRFPQLLLCMLCHLLDCWQPHKEGVASWWQVEAAARLMQPLACLYQLGLLQAAEAQLLELASGTLHQHCIETLEGHYEVQADPQVAAARLSSTCAALRLVVGLATVNPAEIEQSTRLLTTTHLCNGVHRRMHTLLADRAVLARALAAAQGMHAQQLLAAHDVSPRLAAWVLDYLRVKPGCTPDAPSEQYDSEFGVAQVLLAVRMVLEDTLGDLCTQQQEQQALASLDIDLPRLTVTLRYAQLLESLQGLFDTSSSAPPLYDAQLHALEEHLHNLHNLLVGSGLAQLPVQRNAAPAEVNTGAAAVLEVVDVWELLPPSLAHTIKVCGEQLLRSAERVVECNLLTELRELACLPASCSNSSGSTQWATFWRSGAAKKEQHCVRYSHSVTELYRSLHQMLGSLTAGMMRHGTLQQRIWVAKQLHQVMVVAVTRYISLLEHYAITRSFPECATNPQACDAKPTASGFWRAFSDVPATRSAGSAPASIGTTTTTFSYTNPTTHIHLEGAMAAAAAAAEGPVVTPQLCLVLCSLDELRNKQAELEQELLKAVNTHASHAHRGSCNRISGGSQAAAAAEPDLLAYLYKDSESEGEDVVPEAGNGKQAQSQVTASGLREPVQSPSLECLVFGVGQQERLDGYITQSLHGLIAHVKERLRARLGSCLVACVQAGRPAKRQATAQQLSSTSVVQAVRECLDEELVCMKDHLPHKLLRVLALACSEALLGAARDLAEGVLGGAPAVTLAAEEAVALEAAVHSLVIRLAAWLADIKPRQPSATAAATAPAAEEMLRQNVQLLLWQSKPTRQLLQHAADAATTNLIDWFNFLLAPPQPRMTTPAAAAALAGSTSTLSASFSFHRARQSTSLSTTSMSSISLGDHHDDLQQQHGSLRRPCEVAPIDVLRLLWQRAAAGDTAAHRFMLEEAGRVAPASNCSARACSSTTVQPATSSAGNNAEVTSTAAPIAAAQCSALHAGSHIAHLLLGSAFEGSRRVATPGRDGSTTHEAECSILWQGTCRLLGCSREGVLLLTPSHLLFTTLADDCKQLLAATESMLGRMKAAVLGSQHLAYAPDVSFALPLANIDQLDVTQHKGGEALAVMLPSHARHLLHSFQPNSACELVGTVTLHVKGWGTRLDRSFRGWEVEL